MAKDHDETRRPAGVSPGGSPHPIQDVIDGLSDCLNRDSVFIIDRYGQIIRPPKFRRPM